MSQIDPSDTIVLHQELAYHDVLPVGFEPIEGEPDAYRMAGIEESNHLLLQASVAIEEKPTREQSEDAHPLAADLARIDFKLNLVLQLLGKLVPPDRNAAAVRVSFNSLGANWQLRGVAPHVGLRGLVRIRLHGALPQTLDLYAEIIESDEGTVSARFLGMPPALAELLQKLCFLMHRKRVAGERKTRAD